MAFNNEFPHIEANKLNLNWLLKQYATFNDRLKELHDHFDEAVETMQNSQAAFEQAITNLFNTFKNETNAKVDEIADAVDQINQKTDEYVYNYLSENITEILETNPVLETKYEKIGYIDTNESATYNLETDVIYEIMTIDYALNMHKGLAVNNATHISQVPYIGAEMVADVVLTGGGDDPYVLDVNKGRVLSDENVISLSSSNNVLTVTNNGTNRVRVYAKIIGEL